MTLGDLKLYLRVDSDDLDHEIEVMQQAAEQYLENAGVSTNAENKLVDICTKILVAHWFENRGTVMIGNTTNELDYTLDNIITQLKFTTGSPPISEVDQYVSALTKSGEEWGDV